MLITDEPFVLDYIALFYVSELMCVQLHDFF